MFSPRTPHRLSRQHGGGRKEMLLRHGSPRVEKMRGSFFKATASPPARHLVSLHAINQGGGGGWGLRTHALTCMPGCAKLLWCPQYGKDLCSAVLLIFHLYLTDYPAVRVICSSRDVSPLPDGAREHLGVQVGVVARSVARKVSEPMYITSHDVKTAIQDDPCQTTVRTAPSIARTLHHSPGPNPFLYPGPLPF